METVIFTMGTRGDVQPYIFLARALQEHGHKVTIGTHPLLEGAGAKQRGRVCRGRGRYKHRIRSG